jgi:hypothetical protein
MELAIGTKIRYTSAAGPRDAVVKAIKIGPSAWTGFTNTWMTLTVPVQKGVKFETIDVIPADNGSIKAFHVEVI